jgi:NADH-quinone oxidoreductase subunit L
MFLTFWGENRSSEEVQRHIHESPLIMTGPLVLLAIPAALLGLFIGVPPETGWIHRFLEPVFFELEHEEFAWVGSGGGLMVFSLAVALAGLYLAYVMYVRQTELPGKLAGRFPAAYQASLRKMYMDEVYEVVPIRSTIAFSGWLWTFVDTKVIDGAVNGLAWIWAWFGAVLRPLQTGRVQNYAFGIFAGMVLLVVVVGIWKV